MGSSDIIKGYEVGQGEYLQLDPEELEAIAIAPDARKPSVGKAR